MKYFAGVDAGSTYVKVALIDDECNIKSHKTRKTGINANETTEKIFSELCSGLSITMNNIVSVVSTGYSRRIISCASSNVTEITAHSAGIAVSAGNKQQIKSVIDIGGQDSKVITLNEDGQVDSFIMNDKCAAGTGRFLEALSRTLEIDVSELGSLSLLAENPCQINSLCVVFAESEVISLLARGTQLPDIIAGIHESMAKRIANMAKKAGIKNNILITGGGALNTGLVRSLSDELMTEIVVPEFPQLNGAFGAAVLALDASVQVR